STGMARPWDRRPSAVRPVRRLGAGHCERHSDPAVRAEDDHMMPSITTEYPMPTRIRIHKGGRPRSTRPAIDPGTEELRIKRAALIGPVPDGVKPPAMELASYPLGIMLARGIIGQDQHNAGLQYASLYARAIGRYRDCGIEPQGSEPPADEALEATEALF